MRRADLTINKLVLIIIAILILAALLIFIFKVDILEWLRGLPDYAYEGDKEVDYTSLSPDKLALLGCDEKIAEIGKHDVKIWGDVRELFMLPGNRKISLYVLYENTEKMDFLISVAEKNIGVGKIKDELLTIDKDVIENYDSHDVNKYVSLEDLRLLEGSRLFGRLLCKTKEEVGEIPIRKVILDKEVDVLLDDGEGRCIVKLDFGSYGLKDEKLEYFEDGAWRNVDNEIPDEVQIGLREKRDELVDSLNGLKINYGNKDSEVKLDSEKGLYFYFSGAERYLLTKDRALVRVIKYTYEGDYIDLASDLEQDLMKAFQDALLEQSLDLDYSGGTYRLYGTASPLYTPVSCYSIDQFYNLYKSPFTLSKTWQKYEQPEHKYLYVDDSYWEHMKQRSKIKQDLIEACQNEK